MTTLEEVFIQVGHGDKDHNDDAKLQDIRKFKKTLELRRLSSEQLVLPNEHVQQVQVVDDEEQRLEEEKAPELSGRDRKWRILLEEIRERSQKRLCGVHVAAMLYKKWCYAKRDKRALLCQMVMPMLFMLFGFAIIDLESPSVYPRIELNMEHFGATTPKVPYNSESATSTNPFPAAWSSMPSSYGALQGVDGGDALYGFDAQSGFSLSSHSTSQSPRAQSRAREWIRCRSAACGTSSRFGSLIRFAYSFIRWMSLSANDEWALCGAHNTLDGGV